MFLVRAIQVLRRIAVNLSCLDHYSYKNNVLLPVPICDVLSDVTAIFTKIYQVYIKTPNKQNKKRPHGRLPQTYMEGHSPTYKETAIVRAVFYPSRSAHLPRNPARNLKSTERTRLRPRYQPIVWSEHVARTQPQQKQQIRPWIYAAGMTPASLPQRHAARFAAAASDDDNHRSTSLSKLLVPPFWGGRGGAIPQIKLTKKNS